MRQLPRIQTASPQLLCTEWPCVALVSKIKSGHRPQHRLQLSGARGRHARPTQPQMRLLRFQRFQCLLQAGLLQSFEAPRASAPVQAVLAQAVLAQAPQAEQESGLTLPSAVPMR